MTRARSKPEGQGDLFENAQQLFPVRRPAERVRPVDLSLRIKTAMGQALKECPDNANIIAARMAEILGRKMSPDTLYTFTAQSKQDRQISLIEFVAFVRATGAIGLWDLLVEDDGLVVLQGREAKLAQLGHMRQQYKEMVDSMRSLERELQDEPVRVLRRQAVRP